MTDLWTVGPTAAVRALRACGFSPRQAERLVALKLRYERGVFREFTVSQKRLLFARWLVEHGRLDEGDSLSRWRQHPPVLNESWHLDSDDVRQPARADDRQKHKP